MSKQIILYGAGRYAQKIFERGDLSEAVTGFSIENIVCFADRNKSKYGQTLLGLPIMSLDDALAKYLNADIYVSLDESQKYEVFYTLVNERGIPADRIINYEPVERQVTCEYLENTIGIRNHIPWRGKLVRGLSFCCAGHGIPDNHPLVEFTGNEKETFDDLIQLRSELLYRLKNGLPTQCDGCARIQSKITRSDKHKFMRVLLGSLTICNFACSYCYRRDLDEFDSEELRKELDVDKFMQLIRDYNNNDCKNLWVFCAQGEITAYPKPYRDKIYNAVKDFNVQFVTNASIYDEFIHKHLKTRKGSSINVSLDCGTSETFKKIKGHDMYERVCENLRKYNTDIIGELQMKYIFLPGINDNAVDIRGFVSLCSELNSAVIISSDTLLRLKYSDYNNERMVNAVKYLLELCKEKNLTVVNWSDVTIGKLLAEHGYKC